MKKPYYELRKLEEDGTVTVLAQTKSWDYLKYLTNIELEKNPGKENTIYGAHVYWALNSQSDLKP